MRKYDGDSPHPEQNHGTTFAVLVALSVSHLLNDTIQSLIAAVYPVLKEAYALTFTQIGLITHLAFQFTASLLQPLVGQLTHRPRPASVFARPGNGSHPHGLLLLSTADDFPFILLAAALVGNRVGGVPPGGVAGHRPGVRRATRLLSPCFRGRRTAGPPSARCWPAFVVVPWGQGSLAWFSGRGGRC